MVRNARFLDYEAVRRPILTIGNDFDAGHVLPPHHHQQAQFVYGVSGVMTVETVQGRWAVPPDRAVWIPAGMRHSLRTFSSASTITIWVRPDRKRQLPEDCQVLEMSPLMRTLVTSAADVEAEYDPKGRDGSLMTLLLHELVRLPVLPLRLNFPTDARLAECCRDFLKNPASNATIDEWRDVLGMSRRSFTRLFRSETGMSFATWRQQACLFAALPRLAANESVTQIALDLGYESPAAFTTMFKRLQGVPPSRYLQGAYASTAVRRSAFTRSRNI